MACVPAPNRAGGGRGRGGRRRGSVAGSGRGRRRGQAAVHRNKVVFRVHTLYVRIVVALLKAVGRCLSSARASRGAEEKPAARAGRSAAAAAESRARSRSNGGFHDRAFSRRSAGGGFASLAAYLELRDN